MELQAIIGKVRGRIEDFNASSIVSHLYATDQARAHADNGCETNIDKLADCLRKDNLLDISKAVPHNTGRNVYIHVGITNPQKFFRYLSNQGYVVRDSKLTQEVHRKDSNKPNASADDPHFNIPMDNINIRDMNTKTPSVIPKNNLREDPYNFRPITARVDEILKKYNTNPFKINYANMLGYTYGCRFSLSQKHRDELGNNLGRLINDLIRLSQESKAVFDMKGRCEKGKDNIEIAIEKKD